MKTTKTATEPLRGGRDLQFHLARLSKFGGGTHADSRTKRLRDRSSARRAAIKDQG